MTTSLTTRQRRLYNILCSHIAEHGFAPSIREMVAITKNCSGSVRKDLHALCDAGLIRLQNDIGHGRCIALSAAHLVLAYSDGRLISMQASSIDEARQWMTEFAESAATAGFTWLQTTDMTGCAFKAGLTVNASVEAR